MALQQCDGSEEDDFVELRPGRPIEATPLPKVARAEGPTATPPPIAPDCWHSMRPGARNVSISALIQGQLGRSPGGATGLASGCDARRSDTGSAKARSIARSNKCRLMEKPG